MISAATGQFVVTKIEANCSLKELLPNVPPVYVFSISQS